MPKYTITADDGMPFIGSAELIDNLPEEFAKQIKQQIMRASKGQEMEPVRVPRGLLEQAGWMSKEEYVAEQEEAKQPASTATQQDVSIPRTRLLEAKVNGLENAVLQMRKTQEGHDCSTCPFKEAAMKLIEKTLRGLE